MVVLPQRPHAAWGCGCPGWQCWMHIVLHCPGSTMQRGLQPGPAGFKPCKLQFSSRKIMTGLNNHENLKSNFGEEEQVLSICLQMLCHFLVCPLQTFLVVRLALWKEETKHLKTSGKLSPFSTLPSPRSYHKM